MDSNYELKKIDIKNRACYYFNGIIKTEDFKCKTWYYIYNFS